MESKYMQKFLKQELQKTLRSFKKKGKPEEEEVLHSQPSYIYAEKEEELSVPSMVFSIKEQDIPQEEQEQEDDSSYDSGTFVQKNAGGALLTEIIETKEAEEWESNLLALEKGAKMWENDF